MWDYNHTMDSKLTSRLLDAQLYIKNSINIIITLIYLSYGKTNNKDNGRNYIRRLIRSK